MNKKKIPKKPKQNKTKPKREEKSTTTKGNE
jgi:hypothetical protein